MTSMKKCVFFFLPVSGFSTIFHNFARKAGTFVGAGAGGTIISTIGILSALKCLKDYIFCNLNISMSNTIMIFRSLSPVTPLITRRHQTELKLINCRIASGILTHDG